MKVDDDDDGDGDRHKRFVKWFKFALNISDTTCFHTDLIAVSLAKLLVGYTFTIRDRE